MRRLAKERGGKACGFQAWLIGHCGPCQSPPLCAHPHGDVYSHPGACLRGRVQRYARGRRAARVPSWCISTFDHNGAGMRTHFSSLVARRSSLVAHRLSLLARHLLTKKFYSRGPEGPEKESLRGRRCRGEVTEWQSGRVAELHRLVVRCFGGSRLQLGPLLRVSSPTSAISANLFVLGTLCQPTPPLLLLWGEGFKSWRNSRR